MIHRDFQAVTAAGRLIATFATVELAAHWVETAGDQWPGAFIREVRTAVTERILHTIPIPPCAPIADPSGSADPTARVPQPEPPLLSKAAA